MFNLPRSCRAVHSGNTILHSQQRGTRGPAAPYSRQHLLWSDFSVCMSLFSREQTLIFIELCGRHPRVPAMDPAPGWVLRTKP